MPQFLKINQSCFAFLALSLFGFRWMSAIDSDHYSISGRHRSESLADLLQIRWPTWIGITGRLVSDYAYGVHSSRLYKWRAQALEGLHTLFVNKKTEKAQQSDQERKLNELYSELGRLSTH